MLRLEAKKDVVKFLDSLPPKHLRQIRSKLEKLQIQPLSPDTEQMKGKAAAWRRADIGEYRIIYRVDGDALVVIAIGKRNDGRVYSDFERKL